MTRLIKFFGLSALFAVLSQSPSLATSPQHGLTVSAVPFKCVESVTDINSYFARAGRRTPLFIQGDSVNSFCGEFGGVYYNNVNGMTNLQSIGYQASTNGECNDDWGPWIEVIYTSGNSTFTADCPCSFGNLVGITPDGFVTLQFPNSILGDGGVPQGAVINNIFIAGFPDNCGGNDFGPSILDNFQLNGHAVAKSLAAT